MPKILSSSSQHYVSILKLLAAKDWEIATIHPHVAQSLRNLDIAATPLVEGADRAAREESLSISSRINAQIRQMQYDGERLTPAVKKFINENYAAFCYADLPDIVLFTLLLDKYKPDVIILHNDVEQINRAAAQWARAHGIPALHIPHAIYGNIENPFDIHRIVSVTDLASSGPYQSAWYVDCGLKTDHIYETGLPQFDKYATLSLDKKRSKSGLGIEQNQPVICYTSSWRQDTNITGMHDGVAETYEAVLECAKLLPDIKFIIKTHPNANDAQQHKVKAEEMKAEVIVTANHLPQCLMAADLLLAYGPSNTVLEGAHIPWLRLACTSGYEQDNEIYKIPTDPPDVAKMVAMIGQIFTQPPMDMQKLKQKYLGPCDGMNHKRIAMLIEKLGGQNG